MEPFFRQILRIYDNLNEEQHLELEEGGNESPNLLLVPDSATTALVNTEKG